LEILVGISRNSKKGILQKVDGKKGLSEYLSKGGSRRLVGIVISPPHFNVQLVRRPHTPQDFVERREQCERTID
jgi:hypothetical protein